MAHGGSIDYNELRARIWKRAADPNLSEGEVIQRVLDIVGPALGGSRLSYNRREADEFRCTVEWCAPEATSSLGTTLPTFVADYFLDMGYVELTPETALDHLPPTLRPIAKPLLYQFAKALDLAAVYMVPYAIQGANEGALTLDVCRGTAPKGRLTEDERAVLSDAVQIISTTIARKRAEQALRESESRYRRLFEESNDAIFIHTIDGKIEDVNARACALLQRTREELLDMSVEDLHPPSEKATPDARLQETATDGSTRFESAFVRPDGSQVDVEVSAGIVESDKGLVQGIVRDVSEKKRLEARLRQSEKMQAIGQLAGGVAHDFNNRLVSILGFAQLIGEECQDPQLEDYAERIVKASKRAKHLTSQLLAFARRGDYRFEPVDMHAIIDEVILFLEHSLDKRITVERDLGAPAPFVKGDPAQLQNALLNLALNARDAMHEGGTLRFATEKVTLDAAYCRKLPYEVSPGAYLEIRVADTGVGMDEQTRARIFEPFFTTKKHGYSAGMGLAAVYGTVKHHAGAIEVESEPGRGATFQILLPLADAGPVKAEAPAELVRTEEHARILVIDDEQDVLDVAGKAFEKAGYEVVCFREGAEAVAYFRKQPGAVALVLLDMVMPEMDGQRVFEELRAIDPDARVLLSSGYSVEREARGLLEQGALGFVQKPFEVTELSRLVAEALQR